MFELCEIEPATSSVVGILTYHHHHHGVRSLIKELSLAEAIILSPSFIILSLKWQFLLVK
jgi:hypothetical protein